ncbi:MAG: glycosyltransferase family 39 protein [candidate division WOR-3 bacterium]
MKKKSKKQKPQKQPNPIEIRAELFVKRFFWLLLIVIVILGFGLRAADLRADPPPDLSWSFAPYTDESLNTYSARNFVLYGSWKMDEFLPFVIYPLVNMLVALVFKLFGIGFVQVKLLSLLAGALGIFIIALLVKEETGKTATLLSALMLATCYPLVMYSRLGLVETVQILFLLLTGLFGVKGQKKKIHLILCGFFAFGTVLLVKLSAVFIAPVMLILFAIDFFQNKDKRNFLSRILLFLGGATIAVGIWFFLVFLPYKNEYLQYVLRHSSESPAGHPKNLPAYLFNTFTFGLRSKLLPRMVWIAILGFLALPWLAKKQNLALRYSFLVFLFGLFMLGYMNYRPPRYEIILLPSLIIAAAVSIAKNLRTGMIIPPVNPALWKAVLYGFWLWPFFLQVLLYASNFKNYPRQGSETGILTLGFVIAFGFAFAGYGLLRLKKDGIILKSPWIRTVIVIIFLILTVRLDLGQFYNWFSNRTYNLINYSRELDRLLPENAVVGGSWAPPLMIESRKRALCITDWANINDPINRFGITHLIIGENEADQLLLKTLDPQIVENMTLLRQFQIRGQILRIYALP